MIGDLHISIRGGYLEIIQRSSDLLSLLQQLSTEKEKDSVL